MPLKKGKSKKVISSNIEELLHNYKEDGTIGTSHPKSMKQAQKQAVAIAYSKAKEK
jgi:ABC-type sulfate/molybdate transport systems ATPase subunit